jgi:hypothetical protein
VGEALEVAERAVDHGGLVHRMGLPVDLHGADAKAGLPRGAVAWAKTSSAEAIVWLGPKRRTAGGSLSTSAIIEAQALLAFISERWIS